MGKKRETPRYNVLSFRVSDDELKALNSAIGTATRQSFLLGAALDRAAGQMKQWRGNINEM